MARDIDRFARFGSLGVAILGAVVGSAVAQVAFDGSTLAVAVCTGVAVAIALFVFFVWSARQPERR
ncbi:hypothetical protein [Iamia sp.]|uniref:hypothetical protein n=1 Tax=Iamia sp. TaxID=2722710 RepID=UPI002BBED14E|nr:hypothetical protein [Iamia sp.]HXH57255.1 hypothetical protein [Iamia sp.]